MTQLLVQCDQLHSERVWIHNKLYYFQRIKMKIEYSYVQELLSQVNKCVTVNSHTWK